MQIQVKCFNYVILHCCLLNDQDDSKDQREGDKDQRGYLNFAREHENMKIFPNHDGIYRF